MDSLMFVRRWLLNGELGDDDMSAYTAKVLEDRTTSMVTLTGLIAQYVGRCALLDRLCPCTSKHQTSRQTVVIEGRGARYLGKSSIFTDRETTSTISKSTAV